MGHNARISRSALSAPWVRFSCLSVFSLFGLFGLVGTAINCIASPAMSCPSSFPPLLPSCVLTSSSFLSLFNCFCPLHRSAAAVCAAPRICPFQPPLPPYSAWRGLHFVPFASGPSVSRGPLCLLRGPSPASPLWRGAFVSPRACLLLLGRQGAVFRLRF
jgi:hypothetical protein